MSYDFPEDFFDPPVERPPDWEADPDVRRALDWCLSFISADEWKRRRLAVANWLDSRPRCEKLTAWKLKLAE